MKTEPLFHVDFRAEPKARLEFVPVAGRTTGVGAYSTMGAGYPDWADTERFSQEPGGLRLKQGGLLGGWFSARGTTEIVLTPGSGALEISVGRSVHLEHCVTLDLESGRVELRTLARDYRRSRAKGETYDLKERVTQRAQATVPFRRRRRMRLVIENNRTSISVAINGTIVLKKPVATQCGGILGIYADDAILHTCRQTERRTEKEYAKYRARMDETKAISRRITRSHREDLHAHLRVETKRDGIRLHNAFAGSEITWDRKSGRMVSAASGGPGDLAELITQPFPDITAEVKGRRYVLKDNAASGFKMNHLGATWNWRLQEKSGGRGTLNVGVSLRFHLNGLIVWEIKPTRIPEQSIRWRIDARLSPSLRYKDRCDWLFPENETGIAIVDSDIARNVNGQCTLHDGVHGFSVYLDGHDGQRMEEAPGSGKRSGRIAAMTDGAACRFYTVLSPHQTLDTDAFSKRIVHCCYMDWEKGERLNPGVTAREIPSTAKLKRYKKAGANCIVLHQSWQSINETDWAELETSDKDVKRLRRDCEALGMELVVYISPRWLPINDPGLKWRHRHVPPYFFDWPAQLRLTYLAYAEAATAVHWLHCERALRDFNLDGIYLDGGQSIDWAASTDPRLDRAEKEGYIERNVRQMYGLWRLVQDVGGRFGLEGYGESSGPMRCAYQTARIYGESRDVFTPEMMRNHNNGVLNSGQFNLWAWNAKARRAYNFGVCAVSLADMAMTVGNCSGADDGTPEEWERLEEYWNHLGRVDFDNLIEMQPWWRQSMVRVKAYAATYHWPGHCLVFLFARDDSKRDVEVRLNFKKLGLRKEEAAVQRLHPGPAKPLQLRDGKIKIRLPRQQNGYAALLIK